MDDFRREIRAVFQKEQAAHPPVADFRQRVVHAVTARPRPHTNLQWMTVVAALVLGALVVVSLMSTRLAVRSGPVHPRSTVVPKVPIVHYGTPPAGIPLFYAGDPDHPGWYDAFDWNGVSQGTIKLSQEGRLSQAPDGSSFSLDTTGKGGFGQFLDRLGNPIPGDTPSRFESEMWSDDSKQLCVLDGASGKYRIGLRAPGGPVTSIRDVPIELNEGGIFALSFRSCSPSHDRAVLAYNAFGRLAELWVVKLSTGAIYTHQTYGINSVSEIVASPDGEYIAASSNKSSGYIAGPTALHTVVRRTSDWSVVAAFEPSIGVLGFSADDSTVLVNTTPWASGVATHVETIDLASGRVIVRENSNEELAGFFTEPVGAAFALIFKSPGDQSQHPNVYIVLAFVDGREVGIPGRYLRP